MLLSFSFLTEKFPSKWFFQICRENPIDSTPMSIPLLLREKSYPKLILIISVFVSKADQL